MSSEEEEIIKQLPRSESYEKWRCQNCFFDNLSLLHSCEICDHPKRESSKTDFIRKYKTSNLKGQNEKEKAGIYCPNKECTFYNSLFDQHCKVCWCELVFEGENKPKASSQNLMRCSYCNFQNAEGNEECVSCEQILMAKAENKLKLPRQKESSMKAFGKQIRDSCKQQRQCPFCFQTQLLSSFEAHQLKCKQRISFYRNDQNSSFQRCSELQIQTILYMQSQSQILHWSSNSGLSVRMAGLGYKGQDLQNLHHYIINYAPIIIHINAALNFKYFVKDTHYRNTFEVNSIIDPDRVEWEDRMFDDLHHDATHFQRVKYGTMNFTNDPHGVEACIAYGQSYFLLKNHIRDRCTITDTDSSDQSATIGTFRFIFHVLEKLSDEELKSAIEGSKGKEMKSHVINMYKEIQIHGPVEFSKDIHRLYISKDQLKDHGNARQTLLMVEQFCKKHSIQYELFERESHFKFKQFDQYKETVQAQKRIVSGKIELTKAEFNQALKENSEKSKQKQVEYQEEFGDQEEFEDFDE